MCQFLIKGLNNKTKLTIYKSFRGEVKFKRYLYGVGDACLLFKLCSGTHVLNGNWIDIEVEKVCVCVICAVRTAKVWVTF